MEIYTPPLCFDSTQFLYRKLEIHCVKEASATDKVFLFHSVNRKIWQA